ncbi:hypothetical protein PFICI_00444 [Pestalotiopsis fici W106-1]|uniref:Uncharacterized protein n=1 Tax=Pestalotiopsis fici (strain W106-1 / CGMCC3.15140) TaxID=1229662 RepID=W3XMU6_PESFW|nr:uncharacterized protein PFICI_00444 [Pestalotiopsis fici W106-1]ETS86616.1 hypothetical protein PFICI_00444 [Pestalotiopsis fici W106-1]
MSPALAFAVHDVSLKWTPLLLSWTTGALVFNTTRSRGSFVYLPTYPNCNIFATTTCLAIAPRVDRFSPHLPTRNLGYRRKHDLTISTRTFLKFDVQSLTLLLSPFVSILAEGWVAIAHPQPPVHTCHPIIITTIAGLEPSTRYTTTQIPTMPPTLVEIWLATTGSPSPDVAALSTDDAKLVEVHRSQLSQKVEHKAQSGKSHRSRVVWQPQELVKVNQDTRPVTLTDQRLGHGRREGSISSYSSLLTVADPRGTPGYDSCSEQPAARERAAEVRQPGSSRRVDESDKDDYFARRAFPEPTSFEKRARNKTKEDKYDTRKEERRKASLKEGTSRHRSKRQKKDGKRQGQLSSKNVMKNFNSNAVLQDRVTIHQPSTKGAGYKHTWYGHNGSHGPPGSTGQTLSDLVFTNLNFLTDQKNIAPKPLSSRRLRELERQNKEIEELSSFFIPTDANPSHSRIEMAPSRPFDAPIRGRTRLNHRAPIKRAHDDLESTHQADSSIMAHIPSESSEHVNNVNAENGSMGTHTHYISSPSSGRVPPSAPNQPVQTVTASPVHERQRRILHGTGIVIPLDEEVDYGVQQQQNVSDDESIIEEAQLRARFEAIFPPHWRKDYNDNNAKLQSLDDSADLSYKMHQQQSLAHTRPSESPRTYNSRADSQGPHHLHTLDRASTSWMQPPSLGRAPIRQHAINTDSIAMKRSQMRSQMTSPFYAEQAYNIPSMPPPIPRNISWRHETTRLRAPIPNPHVGHLTHQNLNSSPPKRASTDRPKEANGTNTDYAPAAVNAQLASTLSNVPYDPDVGLWLDGRDRIAPNQIQGTSTISRQSAAASSTLPHALVASESATRENPRNNAVTATATERGTAPLPPEQPEQPENRESLKKYISEMQSEINGSMGEQSRIVGVDPSVQPTREVDQTEAGQQLAGSRNQMSGLSGGTNMERPHVTSTGNMPRAESSQESVFDWDLYDQDNKVEHTDGL